MALTGAAVAQGSAPSPPAAQTPAPPPAAQTPAPPPAAQTPAPPPAAQTPTPPPAAPTPTPPPAAAAPAPAPAAAAPAPTAAPAHLVASTPATVLGQDVHGMDGKNLGRIIDVLVDQNGHPLAAVIDFGGFMGLGNRKIAVDWANLKFDPQAADHSVTINLTPDQLKAAPEYKGATEQVKVIGAPPPAPTKPD